MKQGKQTCKILKEIRRQIAEANDIEFVTSECQYQGDCLGTCPKCEAEVRYLEQHLERKRIAGKAITVLGISAGLISMAPLTSCSNSNNQKNDKETISDSSSVSERKNIKVVFGEVETPDTSMTKDTAKKVTYHSHANAIEGKIKVSNDSISNLSDEDTLAVVPIMPEFPGGPKEMLKFLAKNIKYPNAFMENYGVQGRVIVQIIINKEGDIVNPKVIRSIDPYMDKEALRVIKLMPKWKPGELEDGTKVAVKYTVPVKFKLQ